MQGFYECKHCGNMVGMLDNKGVPIICCGEKMNMLQANTVDAATEKHLPEVTVSGNEITVKVGSVLHPMTEEHHITFVYLETERGGQRRTFNCDEDPVHNFCVVDDKPLAVYEYCNRHGLWKTEIK